MPRERSPDRDKAFKIYREHKGNIANREIARQLGLSEKTVGGWKSKDRWDEQLNGINKRSTPKKERSTPKKPGAPIGNQNAVGNKGGAPLGNQNAVGNSGGGAPFGNLNAEIHGFFTKHLPPEVLEVAIEVMGAEPLGMLWQNIILKYSAIIRAQTIMFVRDQEDETRVVKKMKGLAWDEKTEQMQPEEIEYEIQHAWDKHATFLNAQSRAMSELRGLIKDFLQLSGEDDMRRLQLEKIQQEIRIQADRLAMEKERLEMEKKKLDPPDDDAHEQNSGYEDALNAQAEDVFSDEVEDGEED